MKKNWKETLKLWLGALLLLAESAITGCKKLPKRVMAVCLAAAIVVAMVPVAVFAAETTEAKWAFGTAETAPDDSAYTYSGTLAEAFTAANGNEDTTNTVTYVKLNKDVSMTHTSSATALTLNEGKAMVLDLNSKTYSSSTTSTSGGDATYGIKTEPNSLLTVKNGTISVSSSNDGYAIGIKSEGNLNVLNCTIEASKENANSGAYSISYTGGVATITNCTITATSVGNRARSIDIGTTTPALTIADCTVNAIGGDEAYAFYASEYWGKMEFDVAGTITATCANGAFYSKPTTNEVTVTAGEAEGTATDADASVAATYANKYVKIEPVKYDLYIGGVQVTSANKDDITTAITEAGGTADGTATYDPESETLTLNGFSYTGQGYVYDSPWCAAVFAKNDLTVKVVGSNTVTASVTGSYTAEALNVWGALTITGDSGSSLTLTGAGRDGVGCGGNLKIENVTVNATGTSGLYSDEGNITINNAKVTATATTDQMQYAAAIYAYEGNITIENSTVTANAPHANAVYSYYSNLRYTIKNSNVTISAAKMGIGLTVGTRLFVENSTVEVTSDAGLAIVNAQNNFGAVPRFTGDYVVYAGDDASAGKVDVPTNDTYANKYVKIEPVCTVTVNYGIDGVDNKEIAVTKGDKISLENPAIDGYIFMGWYADADYTTAFDFDTPITAATTIYAKFADYESNKKTLQDAIDTLETAVDNVETALNNKVSTDELTEEIGKLNQAIADAKTYAATQDAALKTTLEAADATMNAAITELQNRVTALETGLTTANGKIDTNASNIDALKTDVSTLETWKTEAQNAITALQSLTNTQGTNISALQAAVADLQTAVSTANSKIAAAEARIAVLEGKVTDLETATENLQTAVTALQTAVAGKADAATVNAAIAELQTAINALETAKNNYVGADDALRTELEGKISAAQTAAISAAETLVNNAKAELQTKIDAKADAATTTVAIQNLQAAVAALEAVKDDYATADAALKTELEGKISAAQTAAISAAETLVNNAKSELQSAIDTKADAATVNAAIANLQNAITALENAKDNYVSADAALKAELEAAIAKAKQEAIDAAKGHIPYIGTNGNWWIGNTDTGVDANGIKGDTGNGIASITTKKENGVTTVTITFTDPEKEPVVFTISDGETGATGADGVGVAKVEKTATNGNVDTYTITLTNGKTFTFAVTNGKDGADGKDGANGKDGADGKDGENGKDGLTPFIGENGNWWIGDTDTGVKAVADDSVPVGSGNVTEAEGVNTVTVVAIVIAGVALLGNVLLAVLVLKKKKSLV